MPMNVLPLRKSSEPVPMRLDATPLPEGIEEFVDQLMDSEWHSYCSRPQREIHGYYVIFRWFPRESQWVVLYVGHGPVSSLVTQHFSGKQRTAISVYLSSFPKEARNLVWIKWVKDPFHPYETMRLDDILTVVAHKYNYGEIPAFNLPDEKPLPDNFSILNVR